MGPDSTLESRRVRLGLYKILAIPIPIVYVEWRNRELGAKS